MESPKPNPCFNRDCPACTGYRLHSEQEWTDFHPYRGHGFTRENGWTHPDLAAAAAARKAELEKTR